MKADKKMAVIQQLPKCDLGERDGRTWEGMRANSFLLCTEWSSIDLVQPASEVERGSGVIPPVFSLYTGSPCTQNVKGSCNSALHVVSAIMCYICQIPTRCRKSGTTYKASFWKHHHCHRFLNIR